MTRICPRCKNPNDDTVKFCTTCGNVLVPPAGQPLTTTPLPTVPGSPAFPSGHNSAMKIIAIAAVAVVVILAVLYFLQASGTLRLLPFSGPAVTPAVTPSVTSYVMTETFRPETTNPVLSMTTPPATLSESPVTSPTTQKPLVCPSDRFACNGECRNLMTDHDNCGSCNITCANTEICQTGHCMAKCTGSQTSCPDGCHDLQYDALNCGICGNACPTGLVCNRSLCSPTVATTIPTYSG